MGAPQTSAVSTRFLRDRPLLIESSWSSLIASPLSGPCWFLRTKEMRGGRTETTKRVSQVGDKNDHHAEIHGILQAGSNTQGGNTVIAGNESEHWKAATHPRAEPGTDPSDCRAGDQAG